MDPGPTEYTDDRSQRTTIRGKGRLALFYTQINNCLRVRRLLHMKIYGAASIESRPRRTEECRVLACWLCSNLRGQIRQLDKAMLEGADRLAG